MRRMIALGICGTLFVAACASGDDTTTDGPGDDADVAEPATEPTAAGDDTATDATDTTDTTAVSAEPATEPTEPAAPATTSDPRPPVKAVGLVPLPGLQLDFTGRPVADPTLVWSVYSGSGGVIVENVGGPLPPGCHGTSFFDPETFDLLQIDGVDLEAYAERGAGGCDNMNQDMEDGVIDGDAVKINDDDVILFDFGSLPADPFDVSTQIVNPDGADGIFRSADPDAPVFDNRLDDADITHVIGADVLFEVLDGGDLSLVQTPLPDPVNCTDFELCLFGRFGVDIIDTDSNPGQVLVSSDRSGLFTFLDEDDWQALVRIVNGCQINDHFWVFAAGSTNVEFDLTVTDDTTGESRSYFNALGNFPEPVLDTQAFATCP